MNLQLDTAWPFGTDLAEELLDAIALLSKSARTSGSIKRVDSEDFKVYWVDTVLRVDIPAETLRG